MTTFWTSHSPQKNQLGFEGLLIWLWAQNNTLVRKAFLCPCLAVSRAWAGCELNPGQGCAPKAAPFHRRGLGEAGQAPGWEGRCSYPVTRWLRGIKSTCNSICFQRRRLGIALLEMNQLRSLEWNVSAAGAKVTFDLGWWLLLAPRAVPCRKAAAGARPVAPCFPECLSATGGSKPLHFLDVPWFLRHWQQMLCDQEKRWLRAHVNFLTNF